MQTLLCWLMSFFNILQFEILFDDDYRAGTTGCANTSSNSLLLCFFRRFWIVLFPLIALVCNVCVHVHVHSSGLSAAERYLWQITLNLNDIGFHIDFTSTLDISQNRFLFVLCLVEPNAAVCPCQCGPFYAHPPINHTFRIKKFT